jgi:hypothetical protein
MPAREYMINVDLMATIVIQADSPEEAEEMASVLSAAEIVALPSFQVVDLATEVDPDEVEDDEDWDDEEDD